MWASQDQGSTWKKTRQMTHNSKMNLRRALNAHPDFFAIWADGHGRQPSQSHLYFSDIKGNVFQLPVVMSADHASPLPVKD